MVGAELRLVVNLVPHDGALLPGRDGLSDGEGEAAFPRLLQELQHLHKQTIQIITLSDGEGEAALPYLLQDLKNLIK